MDNFVRDNVIHVFADKSIFSTDVINKTLYWYGERFRVEFHSHDDKFFEITLRPSPSSEAHEDLLVYLAKVERDLIDFRLRDVVNKETQTIRELLIAKAFSRFDEETADKKDYQDPVQKRQEREGQ